jgi:hypothetical protein
MEPCSAPQNDGDNQYQPGKFHLNLLPQSELLEQAHQQRSEICFDT